MIFRQFHIRPGAGSPLTGLLGGGVSALMGIATTLTALGVLMLLFPLLLAMVVASLFFAIAFVCLTLAWRLYRAARLAARAQRSQGYTQVRIVDQDD